MRQFLDGEPDYIPPDGIGFWICCDCHLTHMFRVIQDPNGHGFVIYAYRDEFSTRKYRAERRKKKKK